MHPDLLAALEAYLVREVPPHPHHRHDLLDAVIRAWDALYLPATFTRTEFYSLSTLVAGILGAWQVYHGPEPIELGAAGPLDRDQVMLRLIKGGGG